MRSHVIMFIFFNLLVNLQGVHANLWSTWVGDKEETSSSRDVTRRTGDISISSDPDPAIEDVEASSEDAEIITWPVTSMIKRKTTRRKLRVHKQSAELEKLRLKKKALHQTLRNVKAGYYSWIISDKAYRRIYEVVPDKLLRNNMLV